MCCSKTFWIRSVVGYVKTQGRRTKLLESVGLPTVIRWAPLYFPAEERFLVLVTEVENLPFCLATKYKSIPLTHSLIFMEKYLYHVFTFLDLCVIKKSSGEKNQNLEFLYNIYPKCLVFKKK